MQGPEGMIFAGKYKIVKLIGRGGMANVYLGVDVNSGLKVAIKILKPEYSADEEFIRRFDTEAKSVSSLNHANIVKLFGVGHENNFRYIVQEYVEGMTVKELINQNGHLDWRVAVPIVIQVGLALEYAHRNGIIHRDIKPQNILISRDRIAKITDFGIAHASTGNTITMSSGGAMGSVHYFSPEQARGGNVGPGSDIYSVGVMLFEMITGRVPFDGESNVAIAVKHLQDKPPVASAYVPDIPQGLDAIINKCMQKTPERRYANMRQMVTELDALLVDPNGVYGVITAGNDVSEDVNLSFRQDPSYEKIGDLEKSAEARRRSRLRDNIILVLIVVVIIGLVIGLGTLIISSIKNATNIEQSKDYEVKDYTTMTLDEAKAELEDNQIDYDIQYLESDEYAPGSVIAQSISEGVVITRGGSVSKIILTVAKEPETIILADYSTMDKEAAAAALDALGLQVQMISETSEDVEPDIVIRTQPEAQSLVSPGDTIIIFYAIEPTSSVVPSLMGVTLDQARLALEEAGLTVGTIDGADEVRVLPEEQQYVIATNPPAQTTVARRSVVSLTVGTYEDIQRGGTPTPTPVPVQISATAMGSGTVVGVGPYEPGMTCTLTATPNEGYRFDHWEYNGAVVSYDSTYAFIVEEGPDLTLKAVFSALPSPTSTPTPVPVETTAPTTAATETVPPQPEG